MKVLFLTAWYPHRYDAMAGLFVRKHAEAVARQGVDVCVLYLHKDNNINREEIVEQTTATVREIYVYYPAVYLKALHRGWQEVKSRWGMPDVCQLNVIAKNALLPLWLKLTKKIPYLIVEHWSGYHPIFGEYRGFFHKCLAEFTANNAFTILTVSNNLAEAMQKYGLKNKKWGLINNVVDDFFFDVEKIKHPKKTILHVSCFAERYKNICGILRAIKQISMKRDDFQLVLVGTGQDFQLVYDYARSLDLPENLLIWTGEQTPKQVAEWFSRADFFLFFSNYETAGVVISESLATATPIVSTPVGIAPCVVTQQTGLLVSIGDETELQESINYMLDHYDDYDAHLLRQYGQAYSYESVGRSFLNLYYATLENRQN